MGERLWGGFLTILGAIWVWDGWRLGVAQRGQAMFDSLGPDRYIILMGGLLVLTGLIIAFSKPEVEDGDIGEVEGSKLTPFLFLLVLAGYALLLPWFGYTLSTFLFFVAAYYLAGRRRIFGTLVASAVTAALFFLIFPYFSDMSLPRGFVGF